MVRLVAPFAPYIAEELWDGLGEAYSVHQQPWPIYDPALTVEQTITLVIQVNGKVRDRLSVPAGIEDGEAQRLAMESERVQSYLQGARPKNTIVIPGRLVNLVV
jgi:leucyl-tRNA synthetase